MWFEFPADNKRQSTEDFLLACPDMGTGNRGCLKVVSR